MISLYNQGSYTSCYQKEILDLEKRTLSHLSFLGTDHFKIKQLGDMRGNILDTLLHAQLPASRGR